MDFSSIDSYDKETFGKCIRKQRIEQGISLRNLASQIGISAIYMSYIERGQRPAPIKNQNIELLNRIIRVLNIPEEQREFVIDMARCTHEYLKEQSEYLSQNQAKFIREAIKSELTDEDWEDLTNILRQKSKRKKLTNNYER